MDHMVVGIRSAFAELASRSSSLFEQLSRTSSVTIVARWISLERAPGRPPLRAGHAHDPIGSEPARARESIRATGDAADRHGAIGGARGLLCDYPLCYLRLHARNVTLTNGSAVVSYDPEISVLRWDCDTCTRNQIERDTVINLPANVHPGK